MLWGGWWWNPQTCCLSLYQQPTRRRRRRWPKGRRRTNQKARNWVMKIWTLLLEINCKTDWYCNDVGLIFDERRTMQVLVCTCTDSLHISVTNGGNGGWQSSCCTATLSQHPLPQVPNKRHSRVGGKKMSGNVFSRLLSLAEMIWSVVSSWSKRLLG